MVMITNKLMVGTANFDILPNLKIGRRASGVGEEGFSSFRCAQKAWGPNLKIKTRD